MKLSKNFTLYEMYKSDIATRLGIDNTPNKQQIQGLTNLCINVLQPCRDTLGPIVVNSGFRKPELCTAIGSSPRSNHAFGYAADIEASSNKVSNLDLLIWIYENLEFKELIAEHFNKDDARAGWVHVAYQEGNNKGVLKLKDIDHNYTIVTLEHIKSLYANETL